MTEHVQLILTVAQLLLSCGVIPLMSALWKLNAEVANIKGVLHGMQKGESK